MRSILLMSIGLALGAWLLVHHVTVLDNFQVFVFAFAAAAGVGNLYGWALFLRNKSKYPTAVQNWRTARYLVYIPIYDELYEASQSGNWWATLSLVSTLGGIIFWFAFWLDPLIHEVLPEWMV